MRILGIDPGYDRLGWGIVEGNGSVFKAISYNCITTPNSLNISKRLELLFDKLNVILIKYKPEALVIEDLFFNNNAKTAIQVGQARGVIMLSAEKMGVSIFSYSPLQIKMAITGYGKADKNQIQQMVKRILNLKEIPKPDDTADALAVSLTHCFLNKFQTKLAKLNK